VLLATTKRQNTPLNTKIYANANFSILIEKYMREGDHWEDLGVDGWIILGRNSRRWDVGIWTGLG